MLFRSRVAHVNALAEASQLEMNAAHAGIGENEIVRRVATGGRQCVGHGERSPCTRPRDGRQAWDARAERLQLDARVYFGAAPLRRELILSHRFLIVFKAERLGSKSRTVGRRCLG